MFFVKDGVPVSAFHDIPLWADKVSEQAFLGGSCKELTFS
jgi:hypothetical protein